MSCNRCRTTLSILAFSVLGAAAQSVPAPDDAAQLSIARSESLEKQGQFYEAREVLRQAAAGNDPAVLARLSELEDISGRDAAQSYLRLAEALEKDGAQSAGYLRALQRGLEVALRDNDAPTAAACAARLKAAGLQTLTAAAPVSHDDFNRVVVPGGLEALAYIAHSTLKSPRDRFFVEYAKAIRANTKARDVPARIYVLGIQRHFQLVRSLEELGARDHDRVKFHLSLEDKQSEQQTGKILNLLGWKLSENKDSITIEAGEEEGQAEKQETTAALAIDEAALRDALQARQPFDFEIHDESVPVLLAEDVWQKTFYPKENPAGGFAEAMARDLRMAKVYAGLSNIDKDALDALLAGTDLKVLAEKYADLIYWYASALAVRQQHASVPGGLAAESIWAHLAGAPPANPSQFFHALLEKDEGKLLAYYATLAQLDPAHQRFFLCTSSRTSKFYQFFRQSPEVVAGVAKETNHTTLLVFLREIPLDQNGNVDFPGCAALWKGVKGWSSPAEPSSGNNIRKAIAPDEEDEILLRLVRTHSKLAQPNYSELDNFVAVARIDAHRTQRLDNASVVLLSSQFAENRGAYPYFTCLTALTPAQFQSFFKLVGKLRVMPELELNSVLGEFHALTKLLCMAQESRALPPDRAAEIFGELSDKFYAAASPADFATASLHILRELVPSNAADPDEAIRTLLLGHSPPVSFVLDGADYQIDPLERRATDFRQVLELQNVPPLTALCQFEEAALKLIANKGASAENVRSLEAAAAKLPAVDSSKALHLTLRELAKAGRRDPKEIERLGRELLADINPQVRLALTGIVYACYFRPGDLLISEDPLFLRKHEFVDLGRAEHPSPFRETPELRIRSEGSGSYLKGGFAGFSRVAGRVANSGPEHGTDSEMVFAAQIGSLRATDWRNIDDRSMLLFGLKVRLGREWIEHAYANPEVLSELADGAVGILSLGRRARLLNALRAGDWQAVWHSVTLGDLYFLSDSYLASHKSDAWDSPVIRHLRPMLTARDAAQLGALGSSHPALTGCDHAHLMHLPPYEQYERVLLPNAIAERVSEFKLYLLEYAGEAGIPADVLGALAEPVALEVFRNLQMADMKDWRPVILAYSNVGEDVRSVLHSQWSFP